MLYKFTSSVEYSLPHTDLLLVDTLFEKDYYSGNIRSGGDLGMGIDNNRGNEVAHHILSSIDKTNQHFGINYIASILIGSKSIKILKNQHEQLASHGSLKPYSFEQIRVWIKELIQNGYLLRTTDEYPIVELTDRGQQAISKNIEISLPEPDPALEKKWALDKEESVAKTVELFKQGKTVSEIAKERNFAQATIMSHLAEAYQNGEHININQFVPEEKQSVIYEAFQKLGTDYLSPVKRDLGESFSWSDLKWVRAKLLRQQTANA